MRFLPSQHTLWANLFLQSRVRNTSMKTVKIAMLESAPTGISSGVTTLITECHWVFRNEHSLELLL